MVREWMVTHTVRGSEMEILRHTKRSADEQRAMFGYPVFGRKSFSYDLADDKWYVTYKVGFGMDWNEASYTSVEIHELATNRQKVEF